MVSFASLARIAVVIAAAAALLGCGREPPPPLETTPTFTPKSTAPSSPGAPLVIGPVGERTTVAAGPPPPVSAPPARVSRLAAGPPLAAPSEALSLEQVTLPAFLDEVFSKTLKLNLEIDQSVMRRTDLVTLRTGAPLSAKELFAMAQKILAGYGIALKWDGSVLHVVTDEQLMSQMPALIRGRALPEIPTPLRPIFQVIDLHQVSVSDMMQWLANAYGAHIRLFAAPQADSIMIFGLPQDVEAAVEAVRVLDQARLAGQQSVRVSPVYWTARDLAAKLVEVLKAEGYDASASTGERAPLGAAITIVPVEANNSLIAFSADAKILAHIRRWIADLDQPGQVDPSRNIFVYFVQNTTAASLGNTVEAVLSGGRGAVSPPAGAQLEAAGRTQSLPTLGQAGQGMPQGLGAGGPSPGLPAPAPSQPAAQPAGGPPGATGAGPRIVIDDARNALVLVGSAQDYSRMRPLLLALDKAPREALIEVTVAEIDLNDTNNLGIEWSLLNHVGSGLTQSLGTGTNVLSPLSGSSSSSSSGVGLPLGTSGFNYTIFNNAGDLRLLLNAFAENDRLSVLSTPRVLAESGKVASIEVGEQVPIITSQGTTNTIQNAGTTGILQSIEYQQTGIILSVQPVIHSGDRIDLTVKQEVSDALPNSTPGISSPLIQNRDVSTQLSLSDGQTVVIGGLISENRTADNGGVPYLKDIPGLGLLFKNQALSKQRTELLVFITPYVISSASDATAITDQFQEQMGHWPVAPTQLQW